MSFWDDHYTYAEAARLLGCSRQNVYQEGKRKKIPVDRDSDGKPGIPKSWVEETLKMRRRDDQPA